MIPLRIKIIYGAFLLVLVPVYAVEHGWVNFLWFSDIALIGGFFACVLESRRLASMLLIAAGALELAWLIDFSAALVTGGDTLVGLVDYMFSTEHPLFVRALSLFHVPLPFLLLWLVWRLGYDLHAFRNWIGVGVTVLVVTFFLTDPDDNVNWVYGPPGEPQSWLPHVAWLLVVMVTTVLVWWLTHLLLVRIMRRFGRIVDERNTGDRVNKAA